MMGDHDRLASLFTPDGAVRMPYINIELTGREEIRAGIERMQGLLDYFVQTTHPGSIQLDGDTASGRAYIQELIRLRDDRSELNYATYHDRYQRTPEGWKFTERVYETRYLDTTPLAGQSRLDLSAGADSSSNETSRILGLSARFAVAKSTDSLGIPIRRSGACRMAATSWSSASDGDLE
jgi:hypothetical protein